MKNDEIFLTLEHLLGCTDEIKVKADKAVNDKLLNNLGEGELAKKLSSINSLIIDLYIEINEEKISLNNMKNHKVNLLKQYLIYYEAIKNKYSENLIDDDHTKRSAK